MFIEELKKGRTYSLLKEIDIAKEFRNISLSKDITGKLNSIVVYSSVNEEQVECWGQEFGTIFFQEESAYLLWVCRCTYIEQDSLLFLLNDYMKEVSSIKRYTLNTYKRVGWDIHVLYVYQLVNYNFCYNVIPTSIKWNFDIKKSILLFHSMYNGLTNNAKFLLKIGCFIHDIGVTIAVKDHERLGVKLVEEVYTQLKIPSKNLKKYNINLEYTEIVNVLKMIVGNHQLINQVSAEASDDLIKEKMDLIKSQLSFSINVNRIYNDEFVDMMTLLAVADLMAVDDLLLTEFKLREIFEANNFLKNIINDKEIKRNPIKFGEKRTISLLPDRYKEQGEKRVKSVLNMLNCEQNEFFCFMYNVKHMSYVMAAVKALDKIELSIKLLVICLYISKTEKMKKDLSIEIDPDISIDRLSKIITQFSMIDIINNSTDLSYTADLINNKLIINVKTEK